MRISVEAPAKINLSLDIIGKRYDGYHLVKMVMQTVSLYDTVSVHSREDGEINIVCNNDDVPCDSTNIAYKAAKEFFKYTEIENTGILIKIKKRIPMQAGLAGGSTDGAATLVALNEMFKADLSENELAEIGSKIGADVPFCIYGGTMSADGIGTILNPLPAMPECYFVIVKPDISVSTKEAYALTDEKGFTLRTNSEILSEAICSGNIQTICSSLHNDFEDVLKLEEINKIHDLFKQNGALGSCMSGSGSAVFGIFTDESEAQDCAGIMEDNYNFVYVCEPVNIGCRIE